jgi:transposase
MPLAYGADYRKAAVAFKQAGHTFKELRDAFKITPRTYYQWIEILETSGSVKVEIRRTRRRKTGPDALKKAVEENPDAYLRELSKMSSRSPSSVSHIKKDFCLHGKIRRGKSGIS